MKNVNLADSKFKKLISGKGFYIALCFCLVSVLTAGFVIYRQTVKKIATPPIVSVPEAKLESAWDFTDVNATQSDVEKPAIAEQPQSQLMVMPLSGEIINPFEYDKPVKSDTTGIWSTHNGVDIAADIGTPVKSVSKGIVKEITDDARWGVCVTIDHKNGYITKYCGLGKSLSIKENDEVTIDTVLGSVGDTNTVESSLKPHLHLEMKYNNKYIDPISVIKNGK